MIVAVFRAGFTSWMTLTGDPACGPVMAWPPNTRIWPFWTVTAGYRTGTGREATVVNVCPSDVASTAASGLLPL